MKCGVSSPTFGTVHHHRTKHVRRSLAGALRMKVLWYIPKATSAPPRAGTTGIVSNICICIYIYICVCVYLFIFIFI